MINPVYSLPKLTFIGGSTQTLKFTMQNPYGKPFDADGCKAVFSILHYCNKSEEPVLKVDASLGAGQTKALSVATVNLKAEDTVDLHGRFVYQLSIRNNYGEYDVPGQGIIDITRNIHPDFVTG